MDYLVTWPRRLLVVCAVVLGVGGASAGAARAQGDPLAPAPVPPDASDDYYVPPGYAPAQPPPAQPYPAPAPVPAQPPPAQPYPAPQPTQPYPAQQPYAQPYQPYQQPVPAPRGRPRLERLGRDEAVPPGVEVVQRRRLVLAIVGAGIFAGSYILPAAFMIDSGLSSRRTLVPVFGALMENAHSDYLFGGSWGLAVLDAGTQVLGLTLFALGMRQRRYAVYYVETGRGRTLALRPDVGPRGVALHMAF